MVKSEAVIGTIVSHKLLVSGKRPWLITEDGNVCNVINYNYIGL